MSLPDIIHYFLDFDKQTIFLLEPCPSFNVFGTLADLTSGRVFKPDMLQAAWAIATHSLKNREASESRRASGNVAVHGVSNLASRLFPAYYFASPSYIYNGAEKRAQSLGLLLCQFFAILSLLRPSALPVPTVL